MDYYKYKITTHPDNKEMLLALLGELPFDSFEEWDAGWNAYIPAPKVSKEFKDQLLEVKEQVVFDYQQSFIKTQNWNAIWESQFNPIRVDDFCAIRAGFHQPISTTQYEIVINPKMAFGTGHHATTYMMIQTMALHDFKEKSVFDYGCGTGILAILASLLGAKRIDAIDIDEEAWKNTLENININGLNDITVEHTTLERWKEYAYDVILANINRNVILAALPTLYQRLNVGGKLLISGFIKNDQQLLEEQAIAHQFTITQTINRDSWICMTLSK